MFEEHLINMKMYQLTVEMSRQCFSLHDLLEQVGVVKRDPVLTTCEGMSHLVTFDMKRKAVILTQAPLNVTLYDPFFTLSFLVHKSINRKAQCH